MKKWNVPERNSLKNRFTAIKARCNNKNVKCYPRYGGNGIRCEWKNFDEFMNDMYVSYREHRDKHGQKNTQIDRIDSSGNYCKANCRWVTLKEQSNNRRSIRKITFDGKSLTLTEWSEIIGIAVPVLYTRLYTRKWPLGKVLNSKKYINQYV